MKEKKFSHCNPHLPVKNLRATLDYYRDTLGFVDEWTFGDKDGGIRRDEMRLLFGEDPGFTNDINYGRHRLGIMWFTQNVEEIYAEFQARGINIVDPLQVAPYGLTEFTFFDINGYFIRVAEAI